MTGIRWGSIAVLFSFFVASTSASTLAPVLVKASASLSLVILPVPLISVISSLKVVSVISVISVSISVFVS